MKIKETKGKVYIVGVGPGQEKLITLKALECIKKADVILYDRLISKATLRHRKPTCLLRYVGKYALSEVEGEKEAQTTKQNEINSLILKYAQAGNIVVRLKGGDPFIFGRGAEEILFLKSRGIKCEVIPGISSFYAVPEAWGIPLTHRGLASGFLVVTGHQALSKESDDVDWKSVAVFKGTVVILMGKSNLRQITRKLIKNGMDKKTSCAVIAKGTTKKQKIATGPVWGIADKAKHLSAPAVVVIGSVVNLRLKLNPLIKPLSKKRYLSTASSDLNKDIAKRLKALGARIDCLPMIKISANRNYSVPDRIIANIQEFDWLVFTSRHGVIYFLKRFYELGANKKDLRGKIACVGRGTAAEFIKHKISPVLIPAKFTTKDLALRLEAQGLAGKKVALLRTKLERDPLKDILSTAGARITDCPVYNVEELKSSRRLEKAISKKPDGILFLSPKSMNIFFDLIPDETKQGLNNNSAFFSIGPVTTQALKRRGIDRIFSPNEHTINGLVNLCCEKASS